MYSTGYYCQIVIKLNYLDRFTENFNIIFMEIRLVGVELFCVGRERQRERDGLTDMTNLKIAFSNYTNAPNVQPFNVV